MALEVRLPRFSEEMKEGTVTRWLKAVGDSVAPGEAIAEVETEKVIVEVVAPQAGVLLEILAGEQTVVPVAGLLCRIGERGELGAVQPGSGRAAAPSQAHGGSAGSAAQRATPATQAARTIVAVPPPARGAGAAAKSGALASGAALSPLARRVALDLGLDVTHVRGTGTGGKIVMADLQPFLVAAPRRPTGSRSLPAVIPARSERLREEPAEPPERLREEPGEPPERLREEPAEPAAPSPDIVEEPYSPLRRAVARRMAESKAAIPHFYMTAEVDATDLLALRARLDRKLPEPRPTLNDYLLKAAALALKAVPELNSEYTAEALRRHTAVHLGFAVATDEGLFSPVVRDCHVKSLGAIAEDTRVLILRAKSRSLTYQDLQGGTFTVSNLGMYGVSEFAAIVNPPQVAILAVARPRERALPCNGRMVLRSLLNVTVSADHRALDGVTVARFLQALREAIELPERLLV